MATTPQTGVVLKADNRDIINAVRPELSYTFQERIPAATQDNLKDIATTILNYPEMANEFLQGIVNRIGRVIITSKSYENPLRQFKKGMLEFGESVEEIFVNIANAHPYDPAKAETDVFKREIPDVNAAFHKLNYQNFYKTTVSNEQLRQAFLTEYGLADLITRIIESLYTGSEYDEFLIMKQQIAEAAENYGFYPVNIPVPSGDNASSIVTTMKAMSNNLSFMSTLYNPMHVATHTPKENQIIILNSQFDALMDVNVLATAFNMDKAQFMGQRILIDKFDNDDIVAAIVDRDWFMDWDVNIGFTQNYNGQGLYWNYFYHVWKIFSVSPFANAVLFTTADTSVTPNFTLSPASITGSAGGTVKITNTTTSTGYVPKDLTYRLSDGLQALGITLDGDTITVPAGAKSITAPVIGTSVYDDSKTKSVNLTVT